MIDALTDEYVPPNGGGGGCTPDPFCISVCEAILHLGCFIGLEIICSHVCASPCAVPPLWPACIICLAACTTVAAILCALIAIYGIAPGCEWLCCQV